MFTQSGTFESATQQLIKKAKNASSAVISLMYKMQIDFFATYHKIFESLAKSIIICASPVYALQSLEALESHIALTDFKNTVMNEKRFHKISLLKQVSMIKYSYKDARFN